MELFDIEIESQLIQKNGFWLDENVSVPNSSKINPGVVIERGVEIGKKVSIGYNTIIKQNTIIHNNVKIGANCTIGAIGFGYEKDVKGSYNVIPHIGNVIISKHVEIGNNVCIDKAVLGSTLIGENVKIDNLVHIAHGVKLGKNSMVIANSMIAGSVEIGSNCWISPSASIIDRISIGKDSLIGMGAVVIKDVKSNEVLIGNPAKLLKKMSNI